MCNVRLSNLYNVCSPERKAVQDHVSCFKSMNSNISNGTSGSTFKPRSLIKRRAAPNVSDKRGSKQTVKEIVPDVQKNEVVSTEPIKNNLNAPTDIELVSPSGNGVETLPEISKFPKKEYLNHQKTITSDLESISDVSKVGTQNSFEPPKTVPGKQFVIPKKSTPKVGLRSKRSVLSNDQSTDNSSVINENTSKEPLIINEGSQTESSLVNNEAPKVVAINEVKSNNSSISEPDYSEAVVKKSDDTVKTDAIKKPIPDSKSINKVIRRRAAPSFRRNKSPTETVQPIALPVVSDEGNELSSSNIDECKVKNTHLPDSGVKQSDGDASQNPNPSLIESVETTVPKSKENGSIKNKYLRKRAAPALLSKSIPNKKAKEKNDDASAKTPEIIIPPCKSDILENTKNKDENKNLSPVCTEVDRTKKVTRDTESTTTQSKEELPTDINVDLWKESHTETVLEQHKNVERVIRVYLNSWPKYPRSDPFSDEPHHDTRIIRECGSISIWKQNKFHIAFCDLMEQIDLGKTPKNWAYVNLNKLIKEEVEDPGYKENTSEQFVEESGNQLEGLMTIGADTSVSSGPARENEKDKLSICESPTEPDFKKPLLPVLRKTRPKIPKKETSLPRVAKSKSESERKLNTLKGNAADEKEVPSAKLRKKEAKAVEVKKISRKSSRKKDKENISSSIPDGVEKSSPEVKRKRKSVNKEVETKVKPKINSLTNGKVNALLKKKWKNGETPPDQATLSLKDFIIYVPNSEPMKAETLKDEAHEENDVEECIISTEQPDVPKLIIRDGEIIVDPTSTMIKRTPVPIKTENTVDKSRQKSEGRDLWDVSDTIKFYRTLWKYGIDFSMITCTFPERSRFSIKRKFKFEQRHHAPLVDYVLSGRNVDFKSVMRQLIIISGNEAIQKKKLMKKEIVKPVTTTHCLGPPKKRGKRKKKEKPQEDKEDNSKKQAVLKKLFENTCLNEESENSWEGEQVAELIIGQDDTIDLNDIIKFSTNLVYDNINIVESVSFDPSNVVQPVDFNVTISHDPQPVHNSNHITEEVSSSTVIEM